MGRRCWYAAAAVLAFLPLAADGPPKAAPASRAPAPPADFKLKIALHGVRKTPVATAQLIVHRGVAYQFVSEIREEVLVIDPASARVGLLDLKRKVQTEVSSKRLDAHLAAAFGKISAQVAKDEAAGTRAGRIDAAMNRDLIEPKFEESVEDGGRKIRLSNATVEVTAVGEPEPDGPRLAMMANGLAASLKLAAYREPDALPPFTCLDALRRVVTVHRLRPTEMDYIYRLHGPPKRLRWTYELVPALTDREVEAITRIEGLLKTARDVPFALYDDEDAP